MSLYVLKGSHEAEREKGDTHAGALRAHIEGNVLAAERLREPPFALRHQCASNCRVFAVAQSS